MSKLNFKLMITLMAAIPLMFVMSCNPDDEGKKEETNEFLPVLDENFEFTVDGNDVTFTTTISGNVWVTVNEIDYTMVDQTVTVNLPLEGTYAFTCSTLGSGVQLTSDPFNVVIEQDDLSFLDEGLWKHLSGGANQTKTWKLDLNDEGKSLWFNSPLHFSGADSNPYWAWDVLPEELPYDLDGTEMTSFFNWTPAYADNTWLMAAYEYGTITFKGTDRTVVLKDIEGTETSGSFTFDPETWKMTLSGVVLPIDTSRLNEPQYTEDDLGNVRIFSLSDSAMQIGIKRTYEGLADDGVSQKESRWVNVYNFIVDGYTYEKEEFTYTEPIKTSFTAADLEGTWKFDAVAQDWIGWHGDGNKGTTIESKRLNSWASREEMITTLSDWNGSDVTSIFDAADANEYVFNADGTCTLAGIDNTYSVTDGVITFGTDLTTELQVVFINLTGTSATVLEVVNDADGETYTYEGIWLGQKNGDKSESSAVHLVKQ